MLKKVKKFAAATALAVVLTFGVASPAKAFSVPTIAPDSLLKLGEQIGQLNEMINTATDMLDVQKHIDDILGSVADLNPELFELFEMGRDLACGGLDMPDFSFGADFGYNLPGLPDDPCAALGHTGGGFNPFEAIGMTQTNAQIFTGNSFFLSTNIPSFPGRFDPLGDVAEGAAAGRATGSEASGAMRDGANQITTGIGGAISNNPGSQAISDGVNQTGQTIDTIFGAANDGANAAAAPLAEGAAAVNAGANAAVQGVSSVVSGTLAEQAAVQETRQAQLVSDQTNAYASSFQTEVSVLNSRSVAMQAAGVQPQTIIEALVTGNSMLAEMIKISSANALINTQKTRVNTGKMLAEAPLSVKIPEGNAAQQITKLREMDEEVLLAYLEDLKHPNVRREEKMDKMLAQLDSVMLAFETSGMEERLARLERIEERLAKLEILEQRLAKLDNIEKHLIRLERLTTMQMMAPQLQNVNYTGGLDQ